MIERAANVACRYALAIEIMTQGQERQSLMLARLHHLAAVAFHHHRAAARWLPGAAAPIARIGNATLIVPDLSNCSVASTVLPASSGCLSFRA